MPQQSVAILGPMNEAYASVLTPECIDFVAHLARCFGPRRDQLLARRQARQQVFDNGGAPSFLEDTRHIRESDWQVHCMHHFLHQLAMFVLSWVASCIAFMKSCC